MKFQRPSSWFGLSSVLMLGLLIPATLSAAERPPVDREAAAGHETVDMFAAMKAGDIDVKFIPTDAKGGNILFENKTNKPLAIRLPEAAAGVPALAQFGGGGGFGGCGGGFGGGGMGGGMQGMGMGMGGGMGGMGMGGGMGGFGGGFMNVPAEKVKKVKVATVCLEHGKEDPTPRMPYRLVPIESFTDNQQVIELCKMMGRGEVVQNTAQAAAWHLANGLTWAELLAKDRIRLSNGYTEKYFTHAEIAFAAKVAHEAAARAKKQPEATAGKAESLSQN